MLISRTSRFIAGFLAFVQLADPATCALLQARSSNLLGSPSFSHHRMFSEQAFQLPDVWELCPLFLLSGARSERHNASTLAHVAFNQEGELKVKRKQGGTSPTPPAEKMTPMIQSALEFSDTRSRLQLMRVIMINMERKGERISIPSVAPHLGLKPKGLATWLTQKEIRPFKAVTEWALSMPNKSNVPVMNLSVLPPPVKRGGRPKGPRVRKVIERLVEPKVAPEIKKLLTRPSDQADLAKIRRAFRGLLLTGRPITDDIVSKRIPMSIHEFGSQILSWKTTFENLWAWVLTTLSPRELLTISLLRSKKLVRNTSTVDIEAEAKSADKQDQDEAPPVARMFLFGVDHSFVWNHPVLSSVVGSLGLAWRAEMVPLWVALGVGVLASVVQPDNSNPFGLRWPWTLPGVREEAEKRLKELKEKIPRDVLQTRLREIRDLKRHYLVNRDVLEQLEFIGEKEHVDIDKFEISDADIERADIAIFGDTLRSPTQWPSSDYDLLIVVPGKAHYHQVWRFRELDLPVAVIVVGVDSETKGDPLISYSIRETSTLLYGNGKLLNKKFPLPDKHGRRRLAGYLLSGAWDMDSLEGAAMSEPEDVWKKTLYAYLTARSLIPSDQLNDFDQEMFGGRFMDWFVPYYLNQNGGHPWQREDWLVWSTDFRVKLRRILIQLRTKYIQEIAQFSGPPTANMLGAIPWYFSNHFFLGVGGMGLGMVWRAGIMPLWLAFATGILATTVFRTAALGDSVKDSVESRLAIDPWKIATHVAVGRIIGEIDEPTQAGYISAVFPELGVKRLSKKSVRPVLSVSELAMIMDSSGFTTKDLDEAILMGWLMPDFSQRDGYERDYVFGEQLDAIRDRFVLRDSKNVISIDELSKKTGISRTGLFRLIEAHVLNPTQTVWDPRDSRGMPHFIRDQLPHYIRQLAPGKLPDAYRLCDLAPKVGRTERYLAVALAEKSIQLETLGPAGDPHYWAPPAVIAKLKRDLTRISSAKKAIYKSEDLMKTQELAKALHTHRGLIIKWVTAGDLEPIQTVWNSGGSPRVYRFLTSRLQAYQRVFDPFHQQNSFRSKEFAETLGIAYSSLQRFLEMGLISPPLIGSSFDSGFIASPEALEAYRRIVHPQKQRISLDTIRQQYQCHNRVITPIARRFRIPVWREFDGANIHQFVSVEDEGTLSIHLPKQVPKDMVSMTRTAEILNISERLIGQLQADFQTPVPEGTRLFKFFNRKKFPKQSEKEQWIADRLSSLPSPTNSLATEWVAWFSRKHPWIAAAAAAWGISLAEWVAIGRGALVPVLLIALPLSFVARRHYRGSLMYPQSRLLAAL
jgi:hypothetical protein